eukprot:1140581-Pelagomonas_calceolata.AAC.2
MSDWVALLPSLGVMQARVHTLTHTRITFLPASCALLEQLSDSTQLDALAQVLILLIPNFVEATMYTTAAKISAFGQVPRKHFWLRPAFVSWFYIVSDIVTIIVQAIGIGIWGSARTDDDDGEDTKQQADVGAWIVVAGLILQIISQSIFFLEALYIQYRMDKGYQRLPETRALFFANYWTWGFLQIRNIYRLVAFIQRSVADNTDTGGAGAAEIQPVFFIFEALMIVMSILMFAIYPPGYLLPRASARKAEQMEQVVDQSKDVEKSTFDEDLHAPAEIPDSVRRWVLTPFERIPWLGRVF